MSLIGTYNQNIFRFGLILSVSHAFDHTIQINIVINASDKKEETKKWKWCAKLRGKDL